MQGIPAQSACSTPDYDGLAASRDMHSITLRYLQQSNAPQQHANFISCLQVAESIARKPVDFGRLVFVDGTTTRCAQVH